MMPRKCCFFGILLILIWGGLCVKEDESHYFCKPNTDFFKGLDVLKSKGYVIEKGYLIWKINITGYGGSPNMAYGKYTFNRSADNKLINQYNKKYNANITMREHQTLNNFWFMYGSSAVLINWCLPPLSYYSYGTYVNRRFNTINSSNFSRYHYLPEIDPYGSLSDMLNQHNIKYKSFKSFNSTTNSSLVELNQSIIVSTGDKVTWNDIRESFIEIDNEFKNMLNIQPMPLSYSRFKEKDWMKQLLNNQSVDSFGILLRTASFHRWNFNNSYLTNINQTVFKIYHKSYETSIPRQPYPVYERYNKNQTNTIQNEQNLYGSYFTKYINLIFQYMTSLSNQWQYRSTKISTPFYKGFYEYGFNCIEHGTRCLGDNRDAQYWFTYPDVQYLKNYTLQLLVGIVHSHPDIKICEWGDIIPYFENRGMVQAFSKKNFRSNGVYITYNDLINSSLIFPPASFMNNAIPYNILKKFYVIAYMRPILMERFNFTNRIPTNIFYEYLLPMNSAWFPMDRCYNNPATNTRPPPSTMISETIMEFWNNGLY